VSVTHLSRYTLESGDRSLQIVFGSHDASLPNLWSTRLGVSGTYCRSELTLTPVSSLFALTLANPPPTCLCVPRACKREAKANGGTIEVKELSPQTLTYPLSVSWIH